MAITFKISNGDYVINDSTGRFKTIGNRLGQNDPDQAQLKNNQDLRRCLSLSRVSNNSTAALDKIVGTVPETGTKSIAILINRQIRSMFSAILRLQRLRPRARPDSEKFSAISILKVFMESGSKTSFRFRLGVRTVNRDNIDITGSVG